MIELLLTLLILVLIFGLIWWVFTSLIPLPDPFSKIAQVIIALIFILLLVGILFGGIPTPFRLPR
jgi:hypothetical protein